MMILKILATLFIVPRVLWGCMAVLFIGGMAPLYWGLTEGDWCKDCWAEVPDKCREIWNTWKEMMTA